MSGVDLFNKKEYVKYVNKISPKQNVFYALFKAFWVGGLICCAGEALFETAFTLLKFGSAAAAQFELTGIIALTVLFTGLGVFDKLGMYAGAGTFLPISGFANSIASAALEYKTEGFVFGLSAKFFQIAGPVIVNGILGSFIIGLVYYIIGLF
ncbi:MAG: SpoVA/SpoVAEb family sporulation membrane protein [Firmicutes bacterium]|nr:SpoVA/SpoVAEb family sporulation membrane protein [Bacillota bacterium]